MVADVERAADAGPKAKIFISYSRIDEAFADRLEAALKARGFTPLIDRKDIADLEDFRKRIEALIVQCDTVVFVLSPDSIGSSECKREVEFAATLNKRFAPIIWRIIDDAKVPDALARINRIDFAKAAFDEAIDRLAKALSVDIAWIRRHTEFGEAARRWLAVGRPVGLLLRPPLLEEAEYWMAYRPHDAPPPTAEIQTFVAESRKVEIQNVKTRRRGRAAIYVMLVGIIAGLLGWINQAYIKEQLNWFFVMRPYMLAKVRPYALTAEAERQLRPFASFRECARDCPEMIVIPPGSFEMGSPVTEKGHVAAEGPQHLVTIAKRFAVSKFVVTFNDWDACVSVGGCPQVAEEDFGGPNKPAINITWQEAQQYVAWFSEMTGRPYRLLSEAEWEYAARAGTTTAYFWGDEIGTDNANCKSCGSPWDNRETAPVGKTKPNAFGLYDMAGNIWQWVQDCYHVNYNGAPTDGSPWNSGKCTFRVARAGSWTEDPTYLRSAFRGWDTPVNRDDDLGFRLARSLSQ